MRTGFQEICQLIAIGYTRKLIHLSYFSKSCCIIKSPNLSGLPYTVIFCSWNLRVSDLQQFYSTWSLPSRPRLIQPTLFGICSLLWVGLCSHKIHMLESSPSVCDLIRRYGRYRGNQVKMRSLEWPQSNMVCVTMNREYSETCT